MGSISPAISVSGLLYTLQQPSAFKPGPPQTPHTSLQAAAQSAIASCPLHIPSLSSSPSIQVPLQSK